MAKSLDGLIHHLVDQIALFGERGALPSDFALQVRGYYAHSDSTNIDRPFLEQVWKWLIQNPEVQLGDHAGHERLSLSEVEAQNAATKKARVSGSVPQHLAGEQNVVSSEASEAPADTQAANALQPSEAFADTESVNTIIHAATLPGQSDVQTDQVEAGQGEKSRDASSNAVAGSEVVQPSSPTPETESPDLSSSIRLYTSETRMWHALAGHGPDPNKIKALDFACLSMIAACGSKGIFQHELVKLSGQDKRSLPARTDRLHNDGYIAKKRTAFQQLHPRKIIKTSHLVLKRFAKSESSAQPQKSPEPSSVDEHTESIDNKDGDSNDQVGRPVPTWSPYRSLSSQIFELVARSGTEGMTMKAIRERLFCDLVRKPMDEYIMRLVECWQLSQPLHLRHLSIIRDTSLRAKTTVYTYFTFENFQKLVDEGTGFWDAVKTVPDGATNGINIAASLNAQPRLDEYGFPVLDSGLFEGHHNDATLEDCVSALKADRFRVSRHDPVLMKQHDGTYAVKNHTSKAAYNPQNSSPFPKEGKPSRRNLTSSNSRPARKETVPSPPCLLAARQPAPEPSTSKPRRHTDLIVKKRGRPRKYPKEDAFHDIDTTEPLFFKRLHDSRETAEKYARSKIENEISCRIEEGEDPVSVTNDVLASVETLRRKEGQEPLSKYSREMILHTFAGGPKPENIINTAHNLRKQITYWPSMAAHTLFVPGQLRRSSTRSPHNFKTASDIVAPGSRKRRVPARFEEPGNKEEIPSASKRRRTANATKRSEVPYMPSAAAHSCPALVVEPLNVSAPQVRATGKARRQRGPYLPSIAAHTGESLSALPKPKRLPLKRKVATEISSLAEGGTVPLPGLPMVSGPRYLPSIAAHSTLLHLPQTQRSPNPVLSRNIGEPCPDWIKSLLKYYEREAKGIARPHDGVFPGETKPRKKRMGEPAGPRPPCFKIVIFKNARLKDLNWFTATQAAGNQIQPQSQTHRSTSSLTQSAHPLSLTPALATKTQMNRGSRWSILGDQPKCPTPPASQIPASQPPSTGPMSPNDFSKPGNYEPGRTSVDLEDTLRDPCPSQISSKDPYINHGFYAQVSPSPLTGSRGHTSTKDTNICPPTEDPTRKSSSPIIEKEIPPNPEAAPYTTGQDSDKIEEAVREIRQTSYPLGKLPTIENSLEQSRYDKDSIAAVEELPSTEGETQTKDTREVPIQPSPLFRTSEDIHDINDGTPVSTPGASKAGALQEDPKPNEITSVSTTNLEPTLPHRTEIHNEVPTQISISPGLRQKRSKLKTSQKSFPMMSRRGGSVAALRKKIVMDIMEKCQGVFGGSREMTKFFATEWTKRGQEGTPEEKTIQNTVNSLCDEGRLRQITFAFRSKQGKVVKKAMLTSPDISNTDPRVKEFQLNVMAYYPSHYLPSALKPPEEEPGTETQSFDSKGDRADMTEKIRLGKAKTAEATLATMRLQERARSEHVEQQVVRTEGQQDDINATLSTDPTSDAIRRVPSVYYLPPIPTKRPIADNNRRGGGMERTSARKPSSLGPARPPLPQPEGEASGTSKNLIWLPESFAFIDHNYEEDRPTIMEPAVRRDIRQRHSRYGSQMSATKPSRHVDGKDRTGTGVIIQFQEEHTMVPNRYHRASISHSDCTPTIPIPPASSSHQSTANVGSPLGNGVGSEDRLTYSSPYAVAPSMVNTALAYQKRRNPIQTTQPASEALDMAVPATSSPQVLPSEESHRRQKRLLVSFMDGTHYFHQTTGTFSVSFSGLGPLRQINNWVGTCLRPYSLGPRKFHHEFPAPRGPRNLNLLPRRPLDAEDTQFEQQVDACLDWELETLGLQDVEFKDLPFVNHTFHHNHTTAKPVEPKMDTIAEVLMSSKKGRLFSRRIPKISEIRHKIGKSKLTSRNRNVSAAAAEALKRIERRAPLKRRRLTSLAQPSNTDDIANTITRGEEDRPRKFRRVRGPRDFDYLSPDGEMRLLTAVMVIRTLTGGLEQIVDWVLVAKAFESDQSQTFVRSRWNYVLQKHKSMLPKMESDFQDLFLEAYEEGTMPAIDYENLAGFDWKWLTEWAMSKFKTATISQPELPGSGAEFDNLYKVRDTSKIDINDYYGINGVGQTVAGRAKLINSNAHVHPTTSEHVAKQSLEDGKLSIAKSWIRANVIAPEETYEPSLARAKLETIPNHMIDEALKLLLLDKTLSQENKGRLVPGRNYDISEQFVSRLKKNILLEHFQQATAFKRKLDEDFKNVKSVPFSSASTDGEMLAITNLQAHHRIRVVPVNIPANKWGQTDGSYESRHMDKSRLNFQLDIEPTQTYVYGNPLVPLAEPPSQHLNDPMAKIPLWSDIHGAFVPLMWNMLLAAVMAILAVRPGVGAEEITKNLSPGVETWEVNLVLSWLADVGAASRVGSGYMTTEWWWLVLGEGAGGTEKEVGNGDEREGSMGLDDDDDDAGQGNNEDELMDLGDND